MIELFALLVLAVAYVVTVLLFDPYKIGPFESEGTHLIDGTADCGPVNLFDHVRRLFGAYRVDSNVWNVYEPRMALWRCATCLSFWMSLPASSLYAGLVYLETGDLRTLFLFPIVHGAIGMVVAFVVRLYQILMLIEDKLNTGE